MLVDAGLIGADQLAWARAARAEAGGTLGEHLVLAGHIADEALAELYQARLRVPRVSEEELAGIGPAVLRRIPADMAAELRVLPVAADGEQNLTVAMSDPSDQHAVDEVAFFTGCYVVRAVATQAQIAWGLAHYYGVMTPLWTGGQDPGGEAAEGGVPAAVLEEAPTGPSRARTVRQPVIDPDALELELELAPRSGEITAQAPPREPERLPAVVVEEIEEGDPERPILLERPARAPSGDGSDDGVVLLDQNMRRRRRTSRQTEPGIGRLGAVDSRRERGQDTDVSLGSPWGDGEREEEDAVSRSEESHSKPGSSSAQTRSASSTRARSAPVSVDDGWDLDDGWGPPGTTIPPAYLGATPKALEEEAPSGSIPLQVSDEGTGEVLAAENAEAAPVAAPDEDTAPVPAGAAEVAVTPVAVAAPEPVDPAVLAAELERSSNRLLETVRKLERAPSRDDVIDVLLDHLGGVCQRRAFFVIKGGALHPFKQQGAARPGVGTGALALSEPSTFGQVASSRLPYHGVVSPAAEAFVAGGLGSPPEGEAMVIPILLRGRAIALLYGDGIGGRVFDEHQMVLGRAAGQALERILVSQKST